MNTRSLSVAHPIRPRRADVVPVVSELTGEYLESARLLVQPTAELHLTLTARASQILAEEFGDAPRADSQ
jgi:hypothetical protein